MTELRIGMVGAGFAADFHTEAFKQVNPADPKGAEAQYASRNPTRRLGARPTWGIWWRFC